jgi:hypothetical protein
MLTVPVLREKYFHLGRYFLYFFDMKKIRKTIAENNAKNVFGLRILFPIQKCLKELDFEKKSQTLRSVLYCVYTGTAVETGEEFISLLYSSWHTDGKLLTS